MTLVLGTAINSVICLAIGGALAFVPKQWLKIPLLVVSPIFSAYIIYWAAVFAVGGDQSGEYGSWAGLFIISWSIPGYLALVFGYAVGKSVIRGRRATANKRVYPTHKS